MNRPTRALVTATFSLLSVLSAHAANIKIASLPFNITAPGTYVLTRNLAYTSGSSFAAIFITEPIQGPVVVDLNGFTITSDYPTDSNAAVAISGNATYPTTIRNGTITKFANGINTFGFWNPGLGLTGITIKNIVFNQGLTGVEFGQSTDSSTVSNCTFNSCGSGIMDTLTQGGNSYNNNTFVNTVALSVDSYCCAAPLVLNRGQFAPPAASGLITSAITAQTASKSASIPISFLPFTITAPGTYVLTGNLSYAVNGTPAITINGTITGPVILDLKGFSLTAAPSESTVCVSISEGTGLCPVTIHDGTIMNFNEGIAATFVSNITVKNVIFDQNAFGVYFYLVDTSTILNCSFNSNINGIYDLQSTGGNIYNNNTFGVGGTRALYVQASGTPLVLDRCDFAAPPSN
jgi:hypothetical protein